MPDLTHHGAVEFFLEIQLGGALVVSQLNFKLRLEAIDRLLIGCNALLQHEIGNYHVHPIYVGFRHHHRSRGAEFRGFYLKSCLI